MVYLRNGIEETRKMTIDPSLLTCFKDMVMG